MNLSGAVLVVDDDAAIREALVEVLRDEGLAADSVANGLEALTWLRHQDRKPSVILLDLMMPVMDGWTFLRVRQDDASLSRIPVVVITAGGSCKDLAGSVDIKRCLPKPLTIPKLFAALEACI